MGDIKTQGGTWSRRGKGFSLIILLVLVLVHLPRSTAFSTPTTTKTPNYKPPHLFHAQDQNGMTRLTHDYLLYNSKRHNTVLFAHAQEKNHPSLKNMSFLKSFIRKHSGAIVMYSALVTALIFSYPTIVYAVSSSSLLPASTSTLLAKLSETGFYQAFSLVFVSEIGDKTFFIAGLLAMKAGRLISFVGSVAALAVMTLISVIIGQLFHAVPSGFTSGLPLDDIAAVIAFAFFGLKTLKEASEIQEGDTSGLEEELEEAETAVQESQTVKQLTAWGKVLSTFGLVFAAELGDRSFISTIALSAAQEPIGVAVGAIAAHALATGIAVAGGSYVSKYISERAISYIGGSLFLIFAVTTALGIF